MWLRLLHDMASFRVHQWPVRALAKEDGQPMTDEKKSLVVEPTQGQIDRSVRLVTFATSIIPHEGERMGMSAGLAASIAIDGFGWDRERFLDFAAKVFDDVLVEYQARLVNA
jgi:hypothetical protein